MRNAAAAGQPRGGVGVSLASQGFVTGEGTSGIVPLLPEIEGVANVIFNSYTMGVDVTSLFQAENTFEIGDDASRTIGRHVISVGATSTRTRSTRIRRCMTMGAFRLRAARRGRTSRIFCSGSIQVTRRVKGRSFITAIITSGVYGQDSWRVNPQLTLNYGLRWDVLPPWSEKYNQLLTLNPEEQSLVFPNAPKGILFPGDPGVPNTISPTRYGNVAPRAAASWAPKARPGVLAWMLGAPGATLVKAAMGCTTARSKGCRRGS